MSTSEMVQPTQGDIAAAKALVGLPADPAFVAGDRAVQAFAQHRVHVLEEAAGIVAEEIERLEKSAGALLGWAVVRARIDACMKARAAILRKKEGVR